MKHFKLAPAKNFLDSFDPSRDFVDVCVDVVVVMLESCVQELEEAYLLLGGF